MRGVNTRENRRIRELRVAYATHYDSLGVPTVVAYRIPDFAPGAHSSP
ncbi:MAG: hypothetical protein ACREMD_11590 [Gemmatimonadota bacterium]